MNPAIFVVNAGSSSLKFALFGDGAALDPLAKGEVSGLGKSAHLRAQRMQTAAPATERELSGITSAADALSVVTDWIENNFLQVSFSAIGHRVVHGGSRFHAPILVDEPTLQELESLDPLAPQHQPYNLAAIRTLRQRYPRAAQIACFDTAFHAGWEDRARRIALPRKFYDAGVRRYGFHGLSFEFLSERVQTLVPGAQRVVLAHLGSGASICAVRDGRSVDSTMGFSVLDGLPMATRCGAIDPGVIFHLHRSHALDFDQIEHMLYYDSGLKGASGISADMRDLLASSAIEAAQAVELFVHHCVRSIGGLAAVLGGIEVLVFSGGIGWHAPSVRALICERLGFLGIGLDAVSNAANAERISAEGIGVCTLAIETNEELVIARHCRRLLASREGLVGQSRHRP
ncbi:MAG: acetate/propionate family kinase [Rudaea sp.]|nr:acetate/propionate family kinase [Rudaea sp.]